MPVRKRFVQIGKRCFCAGEKMAFAAATSKPFDDPVAVGLKLRFCDRSTECR